MKYGGSTIVNMLIEDEDQINAMEKVMRAAIRGLRGSKNAAAQAAVASMKKVLAQYKRRT